MQIQQLVKSSSICGIIGGAAGYLAGRAVTRLLPNTQLDPCQTVPRDLLICGGFLIAIVACIAKSPSSTRPPVSGESEIGIQASRLRFSASKGRGTISTCGRSRIIMPLIIQIC